MNIYEHKYLKYKEKYILLKQSLGGAVEETSTIKNFIKENTIQSQIIKSTSETTKITYFSDNVLILKNNKNNNYNIYFYIYENVTIEPLFYKSINNILSPDIICMIKRSKCYITNDSQLYIDSIPPIKSRQFNNIKQMKDEEAIKIWNKKNKENLVSTEKSLKEYKSIIDILKWNKI